MAGPIGEPSDKADRPKRCRPIRVAAKCGARFIALLGIVAQATTFVARLAFIRILPATQSAWDLFRGSLARPKNDQDFARSARALAINASSTAGSAACSTRPVTNLPSTTMVGTDWTL